MSVCAGAPRLAVRWWRASARGALLALALVVGSAVSAEIFSARYVDPTDRYPHGVLGDPSEYTGLEVVARDGTTYRLRWDRPMVFEDVAPRLVDVDLDGAPEVLVVQSHEQRGAQFALYALRDGQLSPLVENTFIGTRFRWLAIVGAADLDGDGFVEVAFVDRPHLAKTLRIWRVIPLGDGTTTVELVGSLPGVTNHRIGERDIAGGLRDCGAGPEMIVADARWQRLLAVRFQGGALRSEDIGAHSGRASFARALRCQ